MSSEQIARLEVRVARLEAEGTILRRLGALPAGGPERERVYRFVEANAAEFPVAVLCEVAEVSRSAYYAWRARRAEVADTVWEEAIFADRIFDIWGSHRRVYGSPRVTQALWRAGVTVSEKRVARLMSEIGIAGASGRRKLRTTRPLPCPRTSWSGTSPPSAPMSVGSAT